MIFGEGSFVPGFGNAYAIKPFPSRLISATVSRKT